MSKKILFAAVMLQCALLTTVVLAGGFRDAGAKMRGDFGGSSSFRRSAPTYYYAPAAPMVVRVAPAAPPAMAQAPTERRSFSVEPSAPAAATPAPAAAPAQAPAVMYYSAPSRGYYRSSEPSYMHPKTDPRRYGR